MGNCKGRYCLHEATEIIKMLKRATGKYGCWCEIAIGNPMVKSHSEACERARAFIERAEGN